MEIKLSNDGFFSSFTKLFLYDKIILEYEGDMMKIRNISYIILMIVFITLAYLFFDRGFNAMTKIYVTYKEKSDISYKVYLHDNDIYDKEYLNMDERYITNLVDHIDIDFVYSSLFNHTLNGFYGYKVIGTLVGYTDDINDSLFRKEDNLLIKTIPLNQNDLMNIKIADKVIIDYSKYIDELAKFNTQYGINAKGYLEVKILIDENLDFFGNDKIIKDEKEMQLIVPLSYDTFKINIYNDNNHSDSYYDFSKREKINYIFLAIGAFCLSLGISFLALTIRNMVNESRDEISYKKKLKRILKEYSSVLVKVKKFYSKHKYNLIYVDSFTELMDAYRRIENPISYKEVKKNEETIFLMIDEDNAWIYRLLKNK